VIPVPTKLRTTITTLVTAGAVVLLPAAARADQYVVDHCSSWDGPAGGVAFPDFTGATTNACGTAAGLHAQVTGPPPTLDVGEHVNMQLSVPADRPNIVIERVRTDYGVPAATKAPPDGATAFMRLFNQQGQVIDFAIPGINQPVRRDFEAALPPGSRSLLWSLFCGGDAGPNGCYLASDVVLDVYKTRLWLNESVAPTLSVTGGTLAGAGAKSGQQTLLFDAADTDSGVSSVTVTLGTTVVGSASYPCTTQDWSPCKREQNNQLLRADTTKAPDGNQELLVTVRDKANNAVTRSLGTVTVANGQGAGAPNGASASRLAKITARFATTKRRSLRVRYGSQPTIRGTLVDEQGKPISGASVAVLQRLERAGADPVTIATVTTAADGTFAYKPAGGPSRTITVAYSAFANDPKPTATSSLRTSVRALLSARFARRSVRPGQRITLTGKLSLLGREGIEVKIQPRDGRVWHTYATVKTTRGGRFRWSYRFKPGAAGRTFEFRARVDSPIYPFAAGSSKSIFMRVR
jgi:hypothetical protein